jgi:ribosomal protein L10
MADGPLRSSSSPSTPALRAAILVKAHPLLVIKGGYFDGAALSPAEVNKLADLESREEGDGRRTLEVVVQPLDPGVARRDLGQRVLHHGVLLVIKGGYFDGAALSPAEVNKLADLESREVLLAKLASVLSFAMMYLLDWGCSTPRP